MTKTQVKQLVEEFEEKVGLSPIEARRSSFIALAVAAGWNNARIGRYLGVHRQRVSQKLEKYGQYAKRGQMPKLAAVMANKRQVTNSKPGVVAFAQEDWEDQAFADGMLQLVSDVTPQAQAA